MKHTPGPWTVEDIRVYAGADCETHPVADAFCNHTCRSLDEQQANARLIAAAPELLEALEGLVAADGAYERFEPMQKALAAIKKARGE